MSYFFMKDIVLKLADLTSCANGDISDTRHVSAYRFFFFNLFVWFIFNPILTKASVWYNTHIYFYYPCGKGLGKGVVPCNSQKKE